MSDYASTRRFTIDETKVQWREVSDEVLILHLPSTRYIKLNDTGAMLWRRLVEGASVSELEGSLREHFGIGEEQAAADVTAFLTSLDASGLL